MHAFRAVLGRPTPGTNRAVNAPQSRARDTMTPDDSRAEAGAAGRNETEAERIDRNLLELLQELRIAGIGVQVLFGFLLAIPFTVQFARLDETQRVLYTADLLLAALAIALLSAPVAHHRLMFHRHEKQSILRIANLAAIAGLAAVGLTVSGSVLLVLSFVWSGAVVWCIAAATAMAIFALWLGLPLAAHRRDTY